MATLGHPLPSRRHNAYAILPAHLALRTSRPARLFPALAPHFLRVGMALYHSATRRVQLAEDSRESARRDSGRAEAAIV